MKKLRLLVIVLVGLWLAAELAVIPLAEGQIESKVAERSDGEAGVSADVDSFPMIARVLLTGRVKELSVTLDQVARQRLTFAEVTFQVSGIEVDRGAILQRNVRIRSIERGTVTASVDLGALGGVLGRISSFLGTDVRVEDGQLHIGPSSFPLGDDLFPCDPEGRIEGERVILTCSITDVPDALLDAAQTEF
jgi:hypothetical protein